MSVLSPDQIAVPVGNQLWVDVVNGVDVDAARGRVERPYKTIQAAIDDAATGDVVVVGPGTYSEIITCKDGVSVRGVDQRNCILSYTGASAVTVVTMAANMHLTDFRMVLSPSANLTTGILMSGLTNATSMIARVRQGASPTSTGTVLGLSITGTGVSAAEHRTAEMSVFAGSTASDIAVSVTGSGGESYIKSCRIAGNSGTGLNVGAGAIVTIRLCSITGTVVGIANAGTVFSDPSTTTSTFSGTGTWTADNESGPIRLGAQIAFDGSITPTILGSSQDDYNPTGWGNANVARLTASVPVNINGFAGGTNGRRISIYNVGVNAISLVNEGVTSAAANRLLVAGGSTTLVSGASVVIIYDGTSMRWRLESATGGAGGPGTTIQTQWVEVVQNKTVTTTTWPLAQTTIAVGSNGAILPQATINVGSTTGFPTSGSFIVGTSTGQHIVTYTGVTATTFTGCSGGTGTLTTGNLVNANARATTIAAGSNGVNLPTGTINVASTTGFPTAGTLIVTTSAGPQFVNYTGVTATTFTGCTGGTGTMSTGGTITNVTLIAQDLLTVNISTSGGALIIIFLTCASNATNNAVVYFRVLVDGVAQRGGSTKSNGGNSPTGTSVNLKVTGLAPGAHNITVQWRVNSGTGQVRPLIAEDESASLLVQEVNS